MTVSSRFLLIELCIDSRMPVTCTWSSVVGSCPAASLLDCAWAVGRPASTASSATIRGVGQRDAVHCPAGRRMVSSSQRIACMPGVGRSFGTAT